MSFQDLLRRAAVACLIGLAVTTSAEIAGAAEVPSGSFSVSGSVGGLYPGAVAQLPVRVDNPEPRALRLESITIVAANANEGCDATNFSSAGFQGSLIVPARGSLVVPVEVRMPRSAPDACQGATFALTFGGSGELVTGPPDTPPSTTVTTRQPPTTGRPTTTTTSPGFAGRDDESVSDDQLSRTGASSLTVPFVAAGSALVLVGFLVVAIARRSRKVVAP